VNLTSTNTKASVRDLWETPAWLVKQVSKILNVQFVLDPCCTEKNKKAGCFFTPEVNGLAMDWAADLDCWMDGGRFISSPAAFVNPPFSQLDEWIQKVIEESQKGLTIALVHPDTPDTAWYQKIEDNCLLQLVPTSRVNFVDPETGLEKSGVNFPSCISVFNGFPRTNVQRVRFQLNKPSRVKAA